MARPFHTRIQGTTQGDMTKGASGESSLGTLKVDDHQDEILSQAFNLQLTRPTDPQSGQPTGNAQIMPSSFVKYVDRTTPLLLNSLLTGEQLTVTTNFWRTKKTGGDENHLTIEFTEVTLVEINAYTPHALLAESKPMQEMEEVKFVYGGFSITHNIASTSASHTWGKAKS